MNTIGEIGRNGEGFWIFSVEDSQIRQCCVNWKVGTYDRESETCEQYQLMIDSGCYGHVCPPWFAPHILLASSWNVEAVTANHEALRHYELKVVYGHVTTNSCKRVLIQITFAVMNVRKPFLSTCAMKRRGVTITFNHNYDRISFRNGTVNLISHDCNSYLCLTLVGDGVDGQEAQEASRRCGSRETA